MKLLTIAIPVYNMEKYLNRCLDSVIINSLEDLIEVIVVNDGSKDNSLKIARQYESNHPCLKVIDKPNGGWGSAINRAIDEATGKYFKILDSDDWFDQEVFKKFVYHLQHNEADLVATSYTQIYDDCENKSISFDENILGLTQFSDIIKANGYKTPFPMATICYKTRLIKDLRVADRFYADVEYVLIPMRKIQSVSIINIDLYQYYLGRSEHSTSITGYQNHFIDYISMMKKIVEDFEHNKFDLNSDLLKIYKKEIIGHVWFAYYLLLSPTFKKNESESMKHLNELEEWLKTNSPLFYKMASKAHKKGLPYIKIWRITGLNILNLRKWI